MCRALQLTGTSRSRLLRLTRVTPHHPSVTTLLASRFRLKLQARLMLNYGEPVDLPVSGFCSVHQMVWARACWRGSEPVAHVDGNAARSNTSRRASSEETGLFQYLCSTQPYINKARQARTTKDPKTMSRYFATISYGPATKVRSCGYLAGAFWTQRGGHLRLIAA